MDYSAVNGSFLFGARAARADPATTKGTALAGENILGYYSLKVVNSIAGDPNFGIQTGRLSEVLLGVLNYRISSLI